MLSSLKIQNFALIQSLDIEFKPGLNIITGETGSGKSVMLGALGLILGNRVDTSALIDTDSKCIFEGKFPTGPDPVSNAKFQNFFKDNDLDWEDNALIRREISPGGKSRAFINDTPVNLNVLKEFGEQLVDIHSQFQTQKLSDAHFQLSLLDAVAGHGTLLSQYGEKYRSYRKTENDLQGLITREQSARKEYDYWSFQVKELDEANLLPNETDALDEELALLSNAEKIKLVLQTALNEISDQDDSINNRLAASQKSFASIASLNTRLQHIYKRLENILIETKDLSGEITDLYESINVDAERLEQVNNRLRIIHNLLVKHGFKTETELLNYADELREKMSGAESLSDEIKEIQNRLVAMKAELQSMADEISKNRKNQVSGLEKQLVTLLKQTGIPEATIEINLTETESLNEFGKDKILVLFSANKGSKPLEVGNVASGGELSRLMLCFKFILADTMVLPTVVFDEIDAGVSGEVAIRVGQMIKKLSSGRQVICITHLPQVAAMGDHQYVVYKVAGKERTAINIRQLENSERIEEIAKMIGGLVPGAAAVESAKELLNFRNQLTVIGY